MNRERFEKIVKQGIEDIPKKFLEKLENVDIVIEDNLSSWQSKKLRARNGSFVLGLYEGIPKTERRSYAQVLPDKITIFKDSIEKVAKNEMEIREIVKNTVWHEIAHHFGMSEKRVRKAENQRNRSDI